MSRRGLRGALIAAAVGSILAPLARTTEPAKQFTAQQKRWWAFQRVVKPPVPQVHNQAWLTNDIDAFILAQLEEKKLAPSPAADRVTLIRRATLDLTGLLPTPEEVQAFVSDASPAAFEKVV